MGISFCCMCLCVPGHGNWMVHEVLSLCHLSFHSDGCVLHPARICVLVCACTFLLGPIFFVWGWREWIGQERFPLSVVVEFHRPQLTQRPTHQYQNKNQTKTKNNPLQNERSGARTTGRIVGKIHTPWFGFDTIPFSFHGARHHTSTSVGH